MGLSYNLYESKIREKFAWKNRLGDYKKSGLWKENVQNERKIQKYNRNS